MASTMTRKSFLPDCKVLAELSERCESGESSVRLVAENRPSAGTSQAGGPLQTKSATEICWAAAHKAILVGPEEEKRSWHDTRISPDAKA